MTIVTLSATAICSLLLGYALSGEAFFVLQGDRPVDVGKLSAFQPRPELANALVRAAGVLQYEGGIRYARPLESDTYRLGPVTDNARLWVEVRVPAGLEDSHFVAPTSFVGRLVPFAESGLRHSGLRSEVRAATGNKMASDAWLLVDGETPSGLRWAIGLVGLCLGFLVFSLYGIFCIVRPVRDA
ncbi:hypothetical protein ACFL5O_02520 [Myxococcota bacterium]